MPTGRKTRNSPWTPAIEDRGAHRHVRPLVPPGAAVGAMSRRRRDTTKSWALVEAWELERFENEGGAARPAIPHRTADPAV